MMMDDQNEQTPTFVQSLFRDKRLRKFKKFYRDL
jgi:hypothetical protein